MAHQPSVKPFIYTYIPADEAQSVKEIRFEGKDDTELRDALAKHFRQQLLSPDQEMDMARHLMEKTAEAQKKKGTSKYNDESENQVGDSEQRKAIIQSYLDDTSFEIVPVVMPMRQTKFVGTSLYIDDSGAFKGLPLNPRACKIAQRDIRGDAFLLSNLDDPALDEWSRVDCGLEVYSKLYEEPPTTSYDTTDKAQMQQTALLRDSDSKKISEEDVKKAFVAKDDGNAFVAQKDYLAAIQAYSTAVELTEGRRDLLQNEAEVTQLRVSSLLNRSMCFTHTGQGDAAARDARSAIYMDQNNPKAYYRLTQALLVLRDYGEAQKAADEFKQHGGGDADYAKFLKDIETGRKSFNDEQKKKYQKMFN
ncbi:malate dehydrogenase (quinone) [Angomonas deanei]|uniref:Tetratricopeptide repeat n=1 Tax=Angomonas deanei TaxID=59799 RepID=S9WUT9_9TRYP|nr:malate dehydrogenase (quinone) [Angomonas deanei]EPY39925.1 malate dehydrogenase (quinone) [Angomonas deanei]EPY40288.1 malate dehydrogenase (quinone) [Angomonas deanei]EPY40424.1 malate dehydrogenase (quinone) [Angomonas deanei]CAD2212882.1 hypothetical protein, conserved [Angomonas deanei]|eukprot:EPY24457.1 malate dehydrogenase (quinone) [Angomonas deanei]